jgi:hypothetical protein
MRRRNVSAIPHATREPIRRRPHAKGGARTLLVARPRIGRIGIDQGGDLIQQRQIVSFMRQKPEDIG